MGDTEHRDNTLGAPVAHEADLPLGWKRVAHLPAPQQLVALQESNAELLRVIAALDEHAPELADEDAAVAHELRRLDFKLDVLLGLVAQLYLRHSDLPPSTAVRLTGRAIEWQAGEPPARGSDVQIELYLNVRYPRPLILFARVDDVSGSKTQATFHDPGDAVQERLDKIIFRHHRRHVAHARKSPPIT